MAIYIDEEYQKKFEEFKKKYQHEYSKSEWDYIEYYFFKQIHDIYAPNIMMQIYGKLGIKDSPAIFYRKHLELIKQNFPIDGNVVEVAAGNFPIFAEDLAKEQGEIGKGTITIYEPALIEMTPKYPNMTLHKEEFTKETDLTGADLVIGIHPCKATWAILENAIKHKKDFYVAMCGCDHTPGVEYMDFMEQSPYLFQKETINLAKRLLKKYPNGELQVTTLEGYPFDFPILYNKK